VTARPPAGVGGWWHGRLLGPAPGQAHAVASCLQTLSVLARAPTITQLGVRTVTSSLCEAAARQQVEQLQHEQQARARGLHVHVAFCVPTNPASGNLGRGRQHVNCGSSQHRGPRVAWLCMAAQAHFSAPCGDKR
jgi:hypothetical protein